MATDTEHLGGVINKASQFIAKVETKESGTRFKMEGPARDDEQQAAQDLSSIRAAADGQATLSGGLKAMQLAAKHLRDAALTGGAPIPGPSPFKPNGLEINPYPFHANGLEVKGSRDRSNK